MEKEKKDTKKETVIMKVLRKLKTILAISVFEVFNFVVSVSVDRYVGAYVMNSIIVLILVTTIALESMQKKKNSCVKRAAKWSYRVSKYILGPIVILYFTVCVFSMINRPNSWSHEFPSNCSTMVDSGCMRIAEDNRYRANQIEMRYAVTFRNSDLVQYLDEWIGTLSNIQVHARPNSTNHHSSSDYFFSSYTPRSLFGIINDVAIKVQPCTEVWKAFRVEVQSQTRVGLKDYGTNLAII